MEDKTKRWGTDLRLLSNLERTKSSRDPGSDLSTTEHSGNERIDLATLSGGDNLVQALLLRFLTPLGEMTELGHPEYGSRLFELIGELNSQTNRNRAKLFTLQALQAEPRVKKVVSVQVTQSRRDRAQMDIAVSLLAIDSDTPINLVFPFFLERGVTS